VLAASIGQLRLTLIPQLMCHRGRMDRKSANTFDIVSIIADIGPSGPFKKVKNNFLFFSKKIKIIFRSKMFEASA
jgi:hypothetical protein